MKEHRIIVYFIDELLTNVQASKYHGSIPCMLAQLKPSGSFSYLEVFTLQTQLSMVQLAAGTGAGGSCLCTLLSLFSSSVLAAVPESLLSEAET